MFPTSSFQNDISVIVLATLLSMLPVTILFWVYYLRERRPTVAGLVMTRFFVAGMFAVFPSLLLERGVYQLSQRFSVVAASAFFTDFFSLERPTELLLAFVVSFGVIALAEETVRWLLLRFVVKKSPELDQVVDGVQLGIASGIGFAFIENTLYFFRLFQRLDFDTLAVVFFLRFLISTFAHISFGGIMGYELVRAGANPLERRAALWRAFLLPWFLHGLFDFFLSIRLVAYAVIFLALPLGYLWWLHRMPQLYERFRFRGRMLRAPLRGRPWSFLPWRRPPVDVLPTIPWCPTCLTVLRDDTVECSDCGTRFLRKPAVSVVPFFLSSRTPKQ